MNLQTLKKAMLAYVSAVKFIWSGIAYPLSIVGKKFMNLRGYRVYGNSVQDGTPTPDNPVEIESVGDLTKKNLFDCSMTPNNVSSTIADTNFTRNDDIYTVNINFSSTDSTENVSISFQGNRNLYNLKPNTTYTVCAETLGGQISGNFRVYIFSGNTYKSLIHINNSNQGVKKVTKFTTTDTDYSTYRIYGFYLSKIDGGCVANNVKLRISCYEGDYTSKTIPDYEPYHKYKIPVVARGRNLIPMFTFKTFTTNGVTFTNNNDGSITLNGTPTGYAATPVISLPESSLEVLRNNACVLTGFYNYHKNITLTLDAKLNGSSVKTIYMNKYSYDGYVKVDLRDISFDSISFSVKRDANDILIDNLTVKPFLEVGTAMPTSFEPYIPPVTTNIFLNEPLRKVGGYADYVDFEKQKVVRPVEVLDDTGTKTIDESLGVINPPTEETIKLPALPQFKGTTIYEVGTNIKPSGMEAKYC